MRTSIIVVVVALVAVGVAWYFMQGRSASVAAITNFDECVAAGYPVIEKVPPECTTPDGKTFVQKVVSEKAEVPSKI